MAKYNKSQTLVLMIALIFSFTLLFGFTMANFGFMDGEASCKKEYSVRSGDTCADIEKMFKLSPVTFASNNPNINCKALFVGQHVCVSPESIDIILN